MSDTEKRVLLAIALSAVFLFAYPYVYPRVAEWISPPKKTEPEKTAEKPGQPGPTEQTPASAAKPAAARQRIIKEKEIKEEFTAVETPLYRAVFTSKGGAITTWELKKHFTPKKDGSRPINLSQTVAARGTLKTSVVVNNAAEDLYFKPSKTAVRLAAGEKGGLIYTAVSSDGAAVEKRYVFNAHSYSIETEITVAASKTGIAGQTVTAINANVAGKDDAGYHTGAITNAGKKLSRLAPDDGVRSGAGNAAWFGVEDKYFLAVFIPKNAEAINWSAEAGANQTSRAALTAPFNLDPGAKPPAALTSLTSKTTFKAFLGPKEHTLLEAEKAGIEDAIEYGVFAFMAQPALLVLNFFQKYVRNYGLAIIILTVILKIVFYPLTAHSLKSMREMQKVQPQLLAIREKFKDNKEKLNKEMMDLYKRYKINPLGGCLPMVLQIPVFLALYEVLYVAIELRQAPFFLWIADLSEKDPYYISPALMGASMFIQQKMTPTTADPMQARIMLFMPAIFTIMFLSFPSGLVIYWLVNNVLSIAQQYYVQRGAAKA